MKLSTPFSLLRPAALLCAPLLIGAIAPSAAVANPTLDPTTPLPPFSLSTEVLQEMVNTLVRIDSGSSPESESAEPLLLDFNPNPESSEAILKASAISPTDLNRAKNLARQAAEAHHGGLSQYRAEASMHGEPEAAPYVDNGDGTVTFSFNGSEPGESTPSNHTIVTVDLRSWEAVVEMSYPL